MNTEILFVIITMCEESTDDYTRREIYLHGIFTKDEIKEHRNKIRGSTCFIIPLNRFLDKGMKL